MRLFIAEKPSAAKAIADVLGNAQRKDGYFDCGNTKVSYCIGHLFTQETPDAYLSDDIPRTKAGSKVWRLADLPIVPETWKYKPKSKTKGQLATLGKLIKEADEVVGAGDWDREGQAIVDHVIEHFKCKVPVKRFCVSAQDAVSIQRGLDNLQNNSDFKGWRDAALARQRADWLVGMNLSRSYTLEAQARGDKSLLVVGRVQSPTLALVVTRDRLIENFNPKDYYIVEATVSTDGGDFKAKWIPDKSSDILDEENRIIDKEAADKAALDLDQVAGRITKYDKESKSTPHPLGFSLSDITLIASNRYGYSAEDTLAGVQKLYEAHKLCSYPRSDCRYLPESQIKDSYDILQAIGKTHPGLSALSGAANLEQKSRIFNDSKITAHHAIIPTMHKGDVSALSEAESRLYEIIARRYIAQFYPKHEYDQTIIEVKSVPQGNDGTSYLLRATGRSVTVNGWKDIYKADGSELDGEHSDVETQLLPPDNGNKDALIKDGLSTSKKTNPPKHFTEGTLIKALEQIHKYVDNNEYRKLLNVNDGLGTAATRSAIIADLRRRKYLTNKGKSLLSTDLGRRLIDTLPESVTSPVLTAKYERELNDIQNNGGSLDDFVKQQVAYVKEHIAAAGDHIAKNPAAPLSQTDSEKPAIPCPDCSKPLIRRKNTFKKTGFWWGCSGHPDCSSTFPDKRGKPDFKVNKPVSNKTEHECPKCGSALVQRKSAKGTIWYGCSSFPSCQERFYDKGGVPEFLVT